MQRSTGYILGFAGAMCVICSVFVAGAAVSLKDRQEENKVIDRQSKVLSVAGLIDASAPVDGEKVKSLFATRIKPVVIDRKSGKIDADADAAAFDMDATMAAPETSILAPANDAKVQRLPNQVLLYQRVDGEKVEALIVPVQGKGLWSTLFGFLALEPDAQTVIGLTFYAHGETPGLGGEIENPRWQGLWKGRKVFGPDGKPVISVSKGQAGSVEADPTHVDGLSGATLTSRGVTNLIQFWLGEEGYGPYLDLYRKEAGINE